MSNSGLLSDVQESRSCLGLQLISSPPPDSFTPDSGGGGGDVRREEEGFYLFPGAHFTLGVWVEDEDCGGGDSDDACD